MEIFIRYQRLTWKKSDNNCINNGVNMSPFPLPLLPINSRNALRLITQSH